MFKVYFMFCIHFNDGRLLPLLLGTMSSIIILTKHCSISNGQSSLVSETCFLWTSLLLGSNLVECPYFSSSHNFSATFSKLQSRICFSLVIVKWSLTHIHAVTRKMQVLKDCTFICLLVLCLVSSCC